MHVGLAVAATTKHETDISLVPERKSALESIAKTSIQEEHRTHSLSQLRCQSSVSVDSAGSMDVFLSAHRLGKTYPSHEMLLYGKGKETFTFHDQERDDDFVFGSREGEYCLLKIRIQHALHDQPVPINNIVVNIQMRTHTGDAMNFKTSETHSHPFCKEVVVLLEPTALQRRVTSGSPIADTENACEKDTRFQLQIEVMLLNSDRQGDLVRSMCWRTVPRTRLLLFQGGRRATRKVWNHVSYAFVAGLRLLPAGKVDSTNRRARKKLKACNRSRTRSPSSEVLWRLVLNSTMSNHP